MTKFISFLSILFFAQSNILADTLNIKTLSFLNGNWKGVLDYTDYQDDKTQVSLPTWVSYAEKNGIIEAQYTYQEPNGKPVYHQSKIGLNPKQSKFRFDDDLFELIESSPNMLLFATQGEDNNKKATIHKKMEWNGDQMTLTKMVKYEDSNTFFVRNTYHFSKDTDEDVQKRLLKTLVGKWVIDLRPTATADAYLKDFTITDYSNKSLSGIFYDTPFENGKIHTDWGKIYFSFTTGDNSGTYFHSGYVENGKIYGTSFSEGRGFIMPWSGIKK